MGFAVAKAAAEAGAEVILIAGPVTLMTPSAVTRVNVESAQQMADAVEKHVALADIFISCAAVADFRPVIAADNKIKKHQTENLQLALVPTKDIVSEVSQLHNKPFIVGFAAETESVTAYAQDKLTRKGMDMIAANQVGDGKGFAVDTNAITVFWQNGQRQLPETSKHQLARQLMALIIENYYAKNTIKTA
jgi:phosphopantothenoylcysteine decarboxylase/phosphopantothenate--cysteine ligase